MCTIRYLKQYIDMLYGVLHGSSNVQALLLCQFHVMAMDLPDTPESAAFFSCLEASGRDKTVGESRGGKGKGKRRRRKDGGQEQTGAAQRPSDPLPGHRRARLVDLLRPISTLLDAHAIVDAPPVRDGAAGEGNGGGTDRLRSRAYDGTIADFMGIALTENFAPRLPRTLVSLFEDFEYHPPDALLRALEGGSREVVDAAEEVKGKDVVDSNDTNGLKTSVDCDPSREGDSTGMTRGLMQIDLLFYIESQSENCRYIVLMAKSISAGWQGL